MKPVGIVAGVIVGGAAAVALESWVVMLLAGALHNSVTESIPAIGFGAAVLVTLALNLVAGFFKR